MSHTTIAGLLIIIPSFVLCVAQRGLFFTVSFYIGGLAVCYLVLKLIEWDFNRSGR